MIALFKRLILKLRLNSSGQSIVEYIVIIAGCSLVCLGVAQALEGGLITKFQDAADDRGAVVETTVSRDAEETLLPVTIGDITVNLPSDGSSWNDYTDSGNNTGGFYVDSDGNVRSRNGYILFYYDDNGNQVIVRGDDIIDPDKTYYEDKAEVLSPAEEVTEDDGDDGGAGLDPVSVENTCTLLLNCGDQGIIIVTGSNLYEAGTVAELTALINDGYSFDGWYTESGVRVAGGTLDPEQPGVYVTAYTVTADAVLYARTTLNQ